MCKQFSYVHASHLTQAAAAHYLALGLQPSQHAVLVQAAESVGLSGDEARAVLEGDEFADAVREQEQFYLNAGIRSVPAVVINDRHLISGGQPPEVFEQALRQIAAE